MIQLSKFQNKAQTGFEPVIFGLRDRRLTTWPLRQISVPSFGEHQLLLLLGFFPMAESLKKKKYGSGGIRTHAHRSGLRPERSALDLSAILTVANLGIMWLQ